MGGKDVLGRALFASAGVMLSLSIGISSGPAAGLLMGAGLAFCFGVVELYGDDLRDRFDGR